MYIIYFHNRKNTSKTPVRSSLDEELGKEYCKLMNELTGEHFSIAEVKTLTKEEVEELKKDIQSYK